jgi:hypothetical protein
MSLDMREFRQKQVKTVFSEETKVLILLRKLVKVISQEIHMHVYLSLTSLNFLPISLIEGAVDEDGRKPSICDTFTHAG